MVDDPRGTLGYLEDDLLPVSGVHRVFHGPAGGDGHPEIVAERGVDGDLWPVGRGRRRQAPGLPAASLSRPRPAKRKSPRVRLPPPLRTAASPAARLRMFRRLTPAVDMGSAGTSGIRVGGTGLRRLSRSGGWPFHGFSLENSVRMLG